MSFLQLTLLQPLILFIPSFSLMLFFGILIIFAEDYLGRIVYAGTKLVFIVWWKVLWMVGLGYWIVSFFGIIYISIKAFLTVSMMVGNFINVYLFGIIAVFIMPFLYIIFFGLIFVSFFFICFLSSLSSFLYILLILDLFSQFFQSLTLSNRLSINMLCGSLLTTLLSLFIKSCSIKSSITLMFLLIVFSFEILNTLIQLFIFMVLTFEYLMIYYQQIYYCYYQIV